MRAQRFKTAQDERAYADAYDKVMALWPVPFESRTLETPFGSTHVAVAGPANAPPLVLLHGRNATSGMWFPNVECWQRQFRLYAVDTIGEPGKSRLYGQPLNRRDNYMRWLSSVLDGLALSQVDLVGHSYGAWLSLSFALAQPSRVRRVVLLEPAQTIQPFALSFALWGLLLLALPSQALLERFFLWEAQGLTPHPDWIRLMILGISTFPSGKEVIASMFSDAELKRVQPSVLLILGQKSVVHNANRCRTRATKLLARSQVVVLAEASHNISLDQPAAVNELVMDFLEKRAQSGV